MKKFIVERKYLDVFINTNHIDTDIVNNFRENCKQFYKKFCQNLRERLDFDDDILVWFNKFSPENVLSGKTNSIIPFLMKMFPNEKSHLSQLTLNLEHWLI